MRYFLDISYKGTHFHGWQIQQNAHTVQEALNNALSKIVRHTIETAGSGRTDTGVHAKHQWVHFDTEVALNNYKHLLQLNAVLPSDIVINHIYKTNRNDAHVRHDAYSRAYEYILSTRPNPFLKELAGFVFKPLNLEAMNKAAATLLLHHDFECFSKVAQQQEHYLCNITKAEWTVENDLLIFNISGNRFLRGMVRLIVGTLIEVGLGKRTVTDFEELITSKNRQKTAAAAPAAGLYLKEVLFKNIVLELC